MSSSVVMEAERVPRRLPPPNRRRDKTRFSCHTCHRRKLKCDRKQPCARCVKSGCGISCTYVGSFLSTGVSPSCRPLAPLSAEQPVVHDTYQRQASPTTNDLEASIPSPAIALSDLVSDLRGNLDLGNSESGYKATSHWTSILNDVREVEETPALSGDRRLDAVTTDQDSSLTPNVLLLQGCRQASKEEILASLPRRAVADRLVAHYFAATEFSLCILHKVEFLKQYDKFWKSPTSFPVSWLGLLFSIFCLSIQFQNPEIRLPPASESITGPKASVSALIQQHRERIVQCLVLAKYGRGGPFTVETLLHYLMAETSLRHDSDMELWLVLGTLVQIAIKMGYHRDPDNFTSLSAFQGEMRRRVWSTIYQADMSVSTQLGLPRIIKDAISDTLQPSNLLDSDFSASSDVLPCTRTDQEVTPALILTSKYRIMSVFSTILDLITDFQTTSYAAIQQIDSRLNANFASIPESCKYRSLSLSIMDPPTLIFQRLYIQILYHRAQIILHLRYFAMARDSRPYEQSRRIAVGAALSILHHHQLIDEESQPGGRLGSHVIQSPFMSHEFLLATSVICFYVHHFKGQIEPAKLDEIIDVSKKTETIWCRTRADSTESMKASKALRIVIDEIERNKGADRDTTADGIEQVTGMEDTLSKHSSPP
ncbi:fungal-specific transcription factor domain-containing protein [Truncatella angustata]|uniref:Fungal-specific transcription factor domain-containing protein n=1 Tax=Truncatella angustata TaxID=152316 RepID=A0A9P8ZUW3_9PEZI|nr:fungal-specific transcription factor domain-containing protein [Truncatella angustata]KAH6651555.1 fungal-specific transcription factor domain-containing protein [Truncatella angustata]